MEGGDGTFSVDGKKFLDQCLNIFRDLLEFRMIDGRFRLFGGGKVISDGIGQDEISVCKTLHQGARAQSIRTVIGEVRLANHKQTGDGAHQVVIHPGSTHGIMHGGINAHGLLVGVLTGDLFIHVEKIAVTFTHLVFTQTLDGIGKIQINTETARPHATTFIAGFLGGARRDITRSQVSIAGIFALEEIIPLTFGDFRSGPFVRLLLGNPDATVVSERLGHQSQFGLMIPADRNAGGMDLRVARVGKERTLLIGTPGGGDITALCIGAEVEDIAVTTGRQHHGIRGVGGNLTSHQVTYDDSLGMTINENQIHHLGAGIHFDGSQTDLT